MTGQNSIVKLTLSSDKALVLFEFLYRLMRDENGSTLLPLVQHDAELWALNSVVCALESELVEPFQENYLSLIDSARDKVVRDAGGAWLQGDWPEGEG